MAVSNLNRRKRIKLGIRKKIKGTPERPRLSVFRSNKNIYAQLIDDLNSKTLVSASTVDGSFSPVGSKTDNAKAIGKTLAEKAKDVGIENVVFDRNGFRYHGRLKALAEGAREAGLKF